MSIQAPPRHSPWARRAAVITLPCWALALAGLIQVEDLNGFSIFLFVLGAAALACTIGFCMEDWKAARPQEYRQVTQTAMWAITIVTAVRWMRHHF